MWWIGSRFDTIDDLRGMQVIAYNLGAIAPGRPNSVKVVSSRCFSSASANTRAPGYYSAWMRAETRHRRGNRLPGYRRSTPRPSGAIAPGHEHDQQRQPPATGTHPDEHQHEIPRGSCRRSTNSNRANRRENGTGDARHRSRNATPATTRKRKNCTMCEAAGFATVAPPDSQEMVPALARIE